MKKVLALMIIAGLTAITPVQADFVETWSNSPSPEGWITGTGHPGTNPGVDGNPGGYLRAERADYDPYVMTSSADSRLLGDIWTQHGDTPELRSDLRIFSEQVSYQVRFTIYGTSGSWYYRFFPSGGFSSSDGWQSFVIPIIDSSWSDTEAKAAGWSDTYDAVSFHNTFADVQKTVLSAKLTVGTGNTGIVGYDNFGYVPEPATIALLGVGSALLLLKKNRQ